MARLIQDYISKELTHFVGRKKPNYDDRYALILEIIKSGELKPSDFPSSEPGSILIRPAERISDNIMYTPYMVCFCDIPHAQFYIHISKYGPFGLSFHKDFIVKKGGRPVHYLPKAAIIKGNSETTIADYFDENVPEFLKLFHLLMYNPKVLQVIKDNYTAVTAPPMQLSSPPDYDLISRLDDLLQFHSFSYLKFYDHTLKDDDQDNYYFEREWRVLGSVKFKMEDIKRIIAPQKYHTDILKNFPQGKGKLWSPDTPSLR